MTLTQRIATRPGYKLLLVAALMIGGMTVDYRTEQHIKAVEQRPVVIPQTAQEVKLAGYFAAKGSPSPDRMAHAVCQTSVPRLMAAVAAVESGGKVTARNKSGAKGAFQVKEKYHGTVRMHPGAEVPQALQSEWILSQLLDEKDGNLRKALNAYGGDTKGRYAKMVLAELAEVPR